MSTHHPHHRHAPKAAMVARAAVVLGFAAAIGLLAIGGDAAPEFVASSANCPGAANAAPLAAL